MNYELKIIEKAKFTPSIKTYILLVVAFFMLISIIGIPIMIIWLLGPGQIYSNKFYKSLSCTLTDVHLEFSRGVLFKKEKTIPLENIQDLTFIQNPLLSLLNLHLLKIETAGNSNPQGMSDMRLIGIENAHEYKKKVLDQRTLLKTQGHTISRQESDNELEKIEVLREIRDLLKEIKEK